MENEANAATPTEKAERVEKVATAGKVDKVANVATVVKAATVENVETSAKAAGAFRSYYIISLLRISRRELYVFMYIAPWALCFYV